MHWQKNEFKKYLAQTSPEPLMFEPIRGDGVYFFDRKGRKYLDLISGISVSALGQLHPVVVSAIEAQLKKYMHTMVYGEFILSPQVQLAKKLCTLLPPALNNVYLVNSGSEAVEGAIKLAFKYTGRRELISCFNAYHGSTTGALSLMSSRYYTAGYKPLLNDVSYLIFNDLSSLDIISEKTAAVFVEPVQGEAGYLPATTEFLIALREKCQEHGTLLVFDEIQTGMGRSGKFWAFEHFGVIPDILLTAKGLGGGLPLGAFISSKEIMSVLSDQPILGHITTFGGNPLSCAAALATIEVLLDTGVIEQVKKKELLFKKYLSNAGLKQISGMGLMLGLETGDFEQTKKIVRNCLQRGLIVDWFLYDSGKLRIAPPLIISEEEIEWACEVISDSYFELIQGK